MSTFLLIYVPFLLVVGVIAYAADRHGTPRRPGRHAATGKHRASTPTGTPVESPAWPADSEHPPTVEMPALRILPSPSSSRTPRSGRSHVWDALDPKAGVKARREAINNLRTAINHVEPNITFAAKSLNEHTENVVQKARADVEAMVMNEAARLGLSAGDAAGLVALPALPGEDGPEVIEGATE